MQAEIPFLLIVFSAAVETLRVIHSPVSGKKNFFICRFGLNLRLVLRFECDTLCPTIERFPVKSQIFDMATDFQNEAQKSEKEFKNKSPF